MKPLVSVVIPAYNHEKYIQDTIKSIINQTYENIELIILDDGSRDLTSQKMSEIKPDCIKRFKRVYFQSKENEGISATLNKLTELSEGKYILTIASDDLAKPELVEKEVSFMENNPSYALITCNDEIIDSEGRLCYWDKKRNIVYDKKKAKYLTFADFLQKTSKVNFNSNEFGTYKTLYLGNYVPNGWMVRKDVFDKIGKYTKAAPSEDSWLMLQVSKYWKLKYLDEILFSYRWHENNTVKDNNVMSDVGIKTRTYEEMILKNINENEVFPEVIDVKRHGACIKKTGIPFIFEICKYRKIQKI